MTGITEMIVSFWFYPVTLFIIIPLTILCGWLLLKLTVPKFGRTENSEPKKQLDEVEVVTE